jgi:large subunit ribosomal protein L16
MAKAIREEYGKLNIRPYPNLPLSKKPLQMRMGRGKGRPERWVASVTRGTPLFEIFGPISFMFIKQLYRLVDLRFPIFSKIVVKKSGRPKNVFETNARCKIK